MQVFKKYVKSALGQAVTDIEIMFKGTEGWVHHTLDFSNYTCELCVAVLKNSCLLNPPCIHHLYQNIKLISQYTHFTFSGVWNLI